MIHTLTAKTSFLRSTGLHLLEHTFYEDYEYILKASAPARDIVFYDIEVYQYLVGNAQQSVSLITTSSGGATIRAWWMRCWRILNAARMEKSLSPALIARWGPRRLITCGIRPISLSIRITTSRFCSMGTGHEAVPARRRLGRASKNVIRRSGSWGRSGIGPHCSSTDWVSRILA